MAAATGSRYPVGAIRGGVSAFLYCQPHDLKDVDGHFQHLIEQAEHLVALDGKQIRLVFSPNYYIMA